MSVEIPWTRIASVTPPRPVLFSGNQEGALGGPDLPVPRMGDRFSVEVRTAQLRQDAEQRLLLAALIEATTADARIRLYRGNLPRQGQAGPTLVTDGAGQSGSVLLVRGGQRGAIIPRGGFLTLVHGGRGYLHMMTREVAVGGDGRATLGLWPMLRFETLDGEKAEADAPWIEGQLTGFDGGGAFVRNRAEPISFGIKERA